MSKGTCSIDGCDRPTRSRGWCHAHYMRWYERGDVGSGPVRAWGRDRGCNVQGCDRTHYIDGHCAAHYKRILADGQPGAVEIRPRIIGDDDASYELVHQRIKRTSGPAKNFPCVDCGGSALHWSYDHSDPDEKHRASDGLPYSVDRDHYAPRCAKCHKRFDMGRRHHAEN